MTVFGMRYFPPVQMDKVNRNPFQKDQCHKIFMALGMPSGVQPCMFYVDDNMPPTSAIC